MKRSWKWAPAFIAAALAGIAAGQDGATADLEERLNKVRREVKIVDLAASIPKVAALVKREKQYAAVLDKMKEVQANRPHALPKLLDEARTLKLGALKDLNEILRMHRGKHTGLTEKEIFKRLEHRFVGVDYEEEWLVNILDDLEEACEINIELDARVYKFDSVTFSFESTSGRAMLQMMGDELLYTWVVRGDTLYVFKERNEVLFGRAWVRAKLKAEKERAKAAKAAKKRREGR